MTLDGSCITSILQMSMQGSERVSNLPKVPSYFDTIACVLPPVPRDKMLQELSVISIGCRNMRQKIPFYSIPMSHCEANSWKCSETVQHISEIYVLLSLDNIILWLRD